MDCASPLKDDAFVVKLSGEHIFREANSSQSIYIQTQLTKTKSIKVIG